MEQKIIYFEKSGKDNTIDVLEAAKKRALELDIKKVIIATTHGYTAIEASKVFKNTDIEIIAVGLSYSCSYEGWDMKDEERKQLEDAGIKTFIGQHSLSRGVAEAFENSISTAEIVASTLYLFSQGMKVAVEVSIMATESGFVNKNEEVIAVAGSSEGCDTAIVLTPSYAWKVKELKIHEIICKPREP